MAQGTPQHLCPVSSRPQWLVWPGTGAGLGGSLREMQPELLKWGEEGILWEQAGHFEGRSQEEEGGWQSSLLPFSICHLRH